MLYCLFADVSDRVGLHVVFDTTANVIEDRMDDDTGDLSGGGNNAPLEEGYLLVRIHVPELNVQKCLQFPKDQLVWDVKQQCLAALPKVCPILYAIHFNTNCNCYIYNANIYYYV